LKNKTLISWPLFQDNLGKPVAENSGFYKCNKRQGFETAVTMARPYAKDLHLAPDHKLPGMPTPYHLTLTDQMPFLTPNQQRQRTDSN